MNVVLFLCTGNYYRSRFAEELFNCRASLVLDQWRARSRALAIERGKDNVGPMSEFTKKALEERAISARCAHLFPQQCSTEDLKSANLIVALKEAEHRSLLIDRFPGWEDRVTCWNVDDVDAGSPITAITEIETQVEKLILQLRLPTAV